MRKFLLANFSICIILCISFTVNAADNRQIDFSQMDQEILLRPWISYQKLISMQSVAKSYDETTYLWWLVRRAETENFTNLYDDFESTVQQARSLINNETPMAIQSRLNLFQGIIHRNHSDYALAEKSFSHALKQAKTINLSQIYVLAKQEIASIKALTDYYETSLNDLQEAYVEAFSLKDQFLMASINETYGDIYGFLQDFEKSEGYYKRALDTYKYLKYPAKIARATGGLASTYRYWKKYDLAIEYFTQYQHALGYLPHSKTNFLSWYGLAITYAEKGYCELAITMIDKTLKLEGLTHYYAELYKKKASCLITLKRLDEAEEALFHAATEFSKLPELMGTSWQLEVIKISGELTYARGNYDLGYKMLEQYYQQYTETMLNNSSNEIIKVKKELESEQRQIIDVLDKKRSQVELLELEHRNRITAQKLYFGLVIFSIVVIVVFVIVLQYKNNKKLRALTIKDPLSDLFNRQYIFDLLGRLISTSSEGKIELAVILIDIDNFEELNDTFGTGLGDDVIRQLANIGKQVFRQGDIFSRIGGEEFLCVLPRTNIYDAEKVAQRFLDIVNSSEIVPNDKYKITISIGVAGFCSQCNDATQLFVNADQALSQAKKLGRNQVNVFKY